jgi:hypothetical protein
MQWRVCGGEEQLRIAHVQAAAQVLHLCPDDTPATIQTGAQMPADDGWSVDTVHDAQCLCSCRLITRSDAGRRGLHWVPDTDLAARQGSSGCVAGRRVAGCTGLCAECVQAVPAEQPKGGLCEQSLAGEELLCVLQRLAALSDALLQRLEHGAHARRGCCWQCLPGTCRHNDRGLQPQQPPKRDRSSERDQRLQQKLKTAISTLRMSR